MIDDVSALKALGAGTTNYAGNSPSAAMLETFPNKYPGNDTEVVHKTDEFSTFCPKTGQPDFGQITITIVPGDKLVETKSLKLYFVAYRNEPTFMETVTERIADDLQSVMKAKMLSVRIKFRPRGGIATAVVASRYLFEDELTTDLDK